MVRLEPDSDCSAQVVQAPQFPVPPGDIYFAELKRDKLNVKVEQKLDDILIDFFVQNPDLPVRHIGVLVLAAQLHRRPCPRPQPSRPVRVLHCGDEGGGRGLPGRGV